MKKLILTITVAAFTAGAYAGGEACAKAAAACAGKDKTATTANATSCCPGSKAKSTGAGETAKTGANKKIVQSPKGAAASKS